MEIKNPEKRLDMFWGRVDRKHINHIADQCKGKDILDMGCGHGTTTAILTEKGFNSIGIDYHGETVAKAQERYPQCTFREANAEALPFKDNQFDTIVLRDALHHFYGEADFGKVKKEILRVAKPDARIVFFDPNVHLLLRTMRSLSRHLDEECDYETALKIMDELGGKVIHKSFNTLYSLPLSGGYVGYNFIPNSRPIWNFILASERFVEKIVNRVGIGRYICWRYVITGELNT